jgi:hypothetical protein
VPRLFLPQLLKVANETLTHERRKIDNAPPAERMELQRLAQQLDSKIRSVKERRLPSRRLDSRRSGERRSLIFAEQPQLATEQLK